eukprot:gene22721-31006_t
MRNNYGKPATRSRLPQNCAVCEFSFPKTSLLGAVSWKTVLRWKLQGGGSNKFVDSAQVCIFCMQFFDKNFGVLVEPMPEAPQKKKKSLQQQNKIGKDFTAFASKYKLSSDLLPNASGGSVVSHDSEESSQYSRSSVSFAAAQRKKKGNKLYRPFRPVKSYPVSSQPRYLGPKSTQHLKKKSGMSKGGCGSVVGGGSIDSKSLLQRKRFFLTDNDSRAGSISDAGSVSSLQSASVSNIHKPKGHLRSSSSSVLRKKKVVGRGRNGKGDKEAVAKSAKVERAEPGPAPGQGVSRDQGQPQNAPLSQELPPVAMEDGSKPKTKAKRKARPGLVVLLTAESGQGKGPQVVTEFELPAASSALVDEKDSRTHAISTSVTKLLHVLRRGDLVDPDLQKVLDVPPVPAPQETVLPKPGPEESKPQQEDGGIEEKGRVVEIRSSISDAVQRPEAEADAGYDDEDFEPDYEEEEEDGNQPPVAPDAAAAQAETVAEAETEIETAGLLDPNSNSQSNQISSHDNDDVQQSKGDFITDGSMHINVDPSSEADDQEDDYEDDYSWDGDQEQEQGREDASSKQTFQQTPKGIERGREEPLRSPSSDLLLAAAAECAPLERIKLLSREVRGLSRGGASTSQLQPPLSSSSRNRARSQSKGLRGKRSGDGDDRATHSGSDLGFGFDEAVVTSKEQLVDDEAGLVLTKSWKSGQHVANAKFLIFSDAIS